MHEEKEYQQVNMEETIEDIGSRYHEYFSTLGV
jgi:hypothetical protein